MASALFQIQTSNLGGSYTAIIVLSQRCSDSIWLLGWLCYWLVLGDDMNMSARTVSSRTVATLHSALSDPLLTVRHPAGERLHLSLPEYLAHLGARDEIEPVALRAHQFHAWHAFLVQLGALVADRTGDRSLGFSADGWRSALLDLAGDAAEDAWSLVVDDLSRPALLQPSIPEGSLDRYKNVVDDPDDLDVVITAKNHDVKAQRIAAPRPEHWLFALVTLQTMQGFLGAGNYGIARMNGGFASRPAVAATPGLGWTARFHRDVHVWLDTRETMISSFGYSESGEHALLWLLPWDGTNSLPLQACDPFFIEVCRRVRLRCRDGCLDAVARPTETSFLAAGLQHGDTGDVWTPVQADARGTKALTVGKGGFTYRLMTKLLFGGEYPCRPALLVRDEDGKEPLFVAQVLVRGSGRTDGYYQRLIPIPHKVRPVLALPDAAATPLGVMARRRVDQAGVAQRFVLHPAVCVLLQGGPDSLDLRDVRTRPWTERLDRAIDEVFFAELWRADDLQPEDREDAWNRLLRELAWRQLEDAMAAAPMPAARRPRALAMAELRFRAAARRHLPVQPLPA